MKLVVVHIGHKKMVDGSFMPSRAVHHVSRPALYPRPDQTKYWIVQEPCFAWETDEETKEPLGNKVFGGSLT